MAARRSGSARSWQQPLFSSSAVDKAVNGRTSMQYSTHNQQPNRANSFTTAANGACTETRVCGDNSVYELFTLLVMTQRLEDGEGMAFALSEAQRQCEALKLLYSEELARASKLAVEAGRLQVCARAGHALYQLHVFVPAVNKQQPIHDVLHAQTLAKAASAHDGEMCHSTLTLDPTRQPQQCRLSADCL